MKSFIAAVVSATGTLTLAACQTPPTGPSGFLSAYEGAVSQEKSLRASNLQRRDEEATQLIDRVFLERAVLVGNTAPELDAAEVAKVLQEVDRQICFEISERFTVLDQPSDDAGRIRTGVTRILPTNPAGSVVSAAASWFIPGPVGVRLPGSMGGLAAEVEMLAPGDRQVAMIAWARNATAVGTDDPSLSKVGDALQFAEPLGDAVGDAFAPQDRTVRPIGSPDPCRAYGSRRNVAGSIAQRLVGFGTGLYVPEVSSTGAARTDAPLE